MPEESIEQEQSAEEKAMLLADIKLTATNMGIKVGNVKSIEKIQEMIDAKNAEADEPKKAGLSLDQLKRVRYAGVRKKAMKLVRVHIAALSPFERQLKNITIDVGNKAVGRISRVIPLNTDWHVEQMVLDALRAKRFRSKKETTDPTTRRKMFTNTFSPSYGIAVLDDLTKSELAELRASQAARHSID